MTDNEKMREGQLWSFVHDSLHEAYKKLSTTGTSNEYYALLDSIAAKVADNLDARFLQAAKAVPVVERQDCGTCENRGRVNGLSQETFCEHCSWSEKWRKNNYKPIAIAGENK